MTPMDHKTLVADLPPGLRAELTTCADAPGLRHFAGHIGVIGLGAALILNGPPLLLVVALMLIQGIAISCLFTALHETTHRTPFKTRDLLLVWLLPLLRGAPFLRVYLLAEHARCPHGSSMLDNTRTPLTTRLVRVLAWNMPYHAEHHAFPAVPFHKLPAFHAHAKAHITHLQPGYIGFHRAYVKDTRAGGKP